MCPDENSEDATLNWAIYRCTYKVDIVVREGLTEERVE